MNHDLIQNRSLKTSALDFGFENYIDSSELIVRRGGTLEANRAAVRTKTDVLLDPVSAQDKAFDTAVAQLALDNDISIAFSVKSVKSVYGLDRVRLIRNMCFAMEICKKMRNNILIVSNASTVYELKDATILSSFGQLLGLSKPKALWSISEAYEGIL